MAMSLRVVITLAIALGLVLCVVILDVQGRKSELVFLWANSHLFSLLLVLAMIRRIIAIRAFTWMSARPAIAALEHQISVERQSREIQVQKERATSKQSADYKRSLSNRSSKKTSKRSSG